MKNMDVTCGDYTSSIDARKDRIAAAKKAGLEPYAPKGNEVTLDLDVGPQLERCKELLSLIHKLWGVLGARTWASKSGLPHCHAVITLNCSISNEARVAIQAILGSDPKREALSLHRVLGGGMQEYPILLFKPNGARELNLLADTIRDLPDFQPNATWEK